MIYGKLDPFSETGTEGIRWSVHDAALPGYDGCYLLRDGDHLRVIDDDAKPLWDGIINLDYTRNQHDSGQAVAGLWVNGLQVGVDPEAWLDMFRRRWRAVLEPVTTEPAHPFVGSSSEMELRLRKLQKKEREELYCATVYPWLYFYSDGEWFSLAKDWGFTLEETCKLIGSPTAEQITRWKTYPHEYRQTLMPFDWYVFTRLALLYGVYAGIGWMFHNENEIAIWMNSGPKRLLLQPAMRGIAAVRDMVYPITL